MTSCNHRILRRALPALATVGLLSSLASPAGAAGKAATTKAAVVKVKAAAPLLPKAAPADPAASLKASPASVAINKPVAFDGSGSTAAAGDTWTLDFGDGSATTSGTAPIAAAILGQHSYGAPGIYSARLTVTNPTTTPASTSTSSFNITANGPAPDGSGTLTGTTRHLDLWAKDNGTAPGTTVPVWGFTLSDAVTPTLPSPTLVATSGETLTITLHNELSEEAGHVALELPGLAGVPDTTGAANGTTTNYTMQLPTAGTFIYEAGGTPGGARQVAMGLAGVLIVRPTTGLKVAYNSGSSFDREKVVAVSELDPEYNAEPFKKDLVEYKPSMFFIDGVAFDPAKPAADPSAAGFNAATNSVRLDVTTGDKVLVRYANLGLRDHSMGLINLRQTESARDSNVLANPVNERAEWLTPGQAADTFVQIPPDATLGTQYPLYDAGFHLNNQGTPGLGGLLTYFNVSKGIGGSPAGPMVACPPATPACVTPIQVNSIDGTFPATNNGVDIGVNVSLVAQGGATVTGAEWFLDTVGPAGNGHAIMASCPGGVTSLACTPIAPNSGQFGGTSAGLQFTIPWADLQPLLAASPQGAFGDHIVWVEGVDSKNVWGQAAGDVVSLPVRDALISSLSISPSVTNGTTPSAIAGTPDGPITINATATASLRSYVVSGAEACVVPATAAAPVAADLKCAADGGNTPLALLAPNSQMTAVAGTVTPPTADGRHWVLVHVQESLASDGLQNRWSPWVYFDPITNAAQPGTYQELIVATSAHAPTVSQLVLNPNPNNGYQDGPGNLGLFAAEQVTGTAVSQVGLPIALAEAFLGKSFPQGTATAAIPPLCTGTNIPAGCLASGSGAEMIPANGHWSDASTKAVAAYLPLADILAQPDGLVPVYVHAKDAAGNWGPLVEVDLTLDKTVPTVDATPTVAAGTVKATAQDPVTNGVSTGIVAAEWFSGADPGTGHGTAITGIPAAAIPGGPVVLTFQPAKPVGTVISIRVKDAAGNWSVVATVTV
jgi:FtsP/CotA-like multicopper oxidase with cupredoxin domain